MNIDESLLADCGRTRVKGMNPKIICIAGRKGSGKSTLARGLAGMILENFGTDNVRILSLAAEIKWLAQHWGVDIYNKDGTDCPFNCTSRQFLQRFGQAMRGIDPDFWIKLWDKEAKFGGSHILIVDDLRFRNELKWFLEHEALVLNLTREGNLPFDPDESEHDLDRVHFDYDIADLSATQTLTVVWPTVKNYLLRTS